MTVVLPQNPAPPGNAIRPNPLTWHQMLVSAFVIGITIWLVEQNVSNGSAMILALIILLAVAFAVPGFADELKSISSGKA